MRIKTHCASVRPFGSGALSTKSAGEEEKRQKRAMFLLSLSLSLFLCVLFSEQQRRNDAVNKRLKGGDGIFKSAKREREREERERACGTEKRGVPPRRQSPSFLSSFLSLSLSFADVYRTHCVREEARDAALTQYRGEEGEIKGGVRGGGEGSEGGRS